MRLLAGLDVTALLGPRTGVGRFTEEVANAVAGADDVELVVYAVTARGRAQVHEVVPDRARLVRTPMAARPLRALWERTNHPVIERWTGTLDVVHGPNFVVPPTRRAAQILTVHDLTCVRFPQLCTPDVLQYPGLVRRAIARGALVHAVSETVAAEIREHFAVEPERVVVIPNGAPSLAPEGPGTDAAAGRALARSERYVLALGTIEPRKDLPGLVRAFDVVADGDAEVRLVVAGQDGWGIERFDEAAGAARHRDQILRLGWVDDRARAALLRGATVFAYPSVYEGFGLPPLEAMAAGTPVLATSAGALPEVVGDAGLLVPVGDQEMLTAGLRQLLDDEALGARLVAAGSENLRRFDWARTTAQLVELYRRAASA